MESGIGYRVPPLDISINEWLEEMGSSIQIVEVKYSTSTTTASQEDFVASETVVVAGALVLYKET